MKTLVTIAAMLVLAIVSAIAVRGLAAQAMTSMSMIFPT